MSLKTIVALIAASGLIIACAQLPNPASSMPAPPKAQSSVWSETHEEAKERILREGGYEGITGNSGDSCRRICVIEPNAISCRQALEDEDCTARAEAARKKMGLPAREHLPLPMPMGDIETASKPSETPK
jgi:hypothetical protein